MTVRQALAEAALALVGLVLAITYRRRLGRAGGVAVGAFAVLAALHLGEAVWSWRFTVSLRSTETGRLDTARLDWALTTDLWMRWGFSAVTVVAIVLLLMAILRDQPSVNDPSARS